MFCRRLHSKPIAQIAVKKPWARSSAGASTACSQTALVNSGITQPARLGIGFVLLVDILVFIWLTTRW